MKKPRSSRLSMTTKLLSLQRENEALREALETIADILEEVGILDGGDEEEIEEIEPEIIEGAAEVADDAKE